MYQKKLLNITPILVLTSYIWIDDYVKCIQYQYI